LPVTLKLYVDANPLLSSGINVSPWGGIRVQNPFGTNLSLWSEYDRAEEIELLLFNQLGSIVLRKTLTIYPSEKLSVSTAGLPSGIYFLSTKSSSFTHLSKIIKQ